MQTLSVEQLVGQNLGNCRVEQLLGRGRLTAVYLARHLAQGSTVSITTFLLPDQFSPQARQRFIARFLKEATTLKTLDHPYILPVYEYGEQFGYPFLTSPYMTSGSLSDVLGLRGRCQPMYVQKVLQQIAEALDYAHGKGVLHQALKPANMLLHPEQRIQVAGFGLINLLQMRGVEYSDYTYAHLLSVAGTYLGSPEYVAPEFVQGQYIDGRADIYALGIMLYELLSGKLPFTGNDPLEVAQEHVQQQIPPIRMLVPDLPVALDEVLLRAVAKVPTQRYQTANELASAFTNAIGGVAVHQKQVYVGAGSVESPDQSVVIAPPGVLAATNKAAMNYQEGRWQLTPPVITGRVPAVNVPGGRASERTRERPNLNQEPDLNQEWRGKAPPIESEQTLKENSALPKVERASTPRPTRARGPVSDIADLDAFAWWSGVPHAAAPEVNAQVAAASKKASAGVQQGAQAVAPMPSISQAWGMMQDAPPPRKVSRRKVVAGLVGGSAAAAVLGVGGFNLLHMMHRQGTAQQAATEMTQPQAAIGTKKAAGNATNAHVVATDLALNSAQDFTNPVDGKGSVVIHLPNGQFAAYETACTHEQVKVNYDPNTRMLVCPAHGAIFDPANKAAVVQGPAMTPLPPVTIHVNGNGTITV